MAENGPTQWPPAPQTREPAPVKKPVNSKAGWVSLILAVLLIAMPFLRQFALIAGTMAGVDISRYLLISLLGLLGWSICGIVFGVMGWRSLPGKIGLCLSAILMLLIAARIIFFWIR